MRKQTLTNAERYITPELKELEETILGAEDKLVQLEYELFRQLREKITGEVTRIQRSAKAIAGLDVLISFAKVADTQHYCRPHINENGTLMIHDGRHPAEYGRKVNLYAPDRTDRTHGTDRQLCTCRKSRYRAGGPDLYTCRSQ